MPGKFVRGIASSTRLMIGSPPTYPFIQTSKRGAFVMSIQKKYPLLPDAPIPVTRVNRRMLLSFGWPCLPPYSHVFTVKLDRLLKTGYAVALLACGLCF